MSQAVSEKPRLVPKRHHPVRVIETLESISLNEPNPGKYIFDMGQNMVGLPILQFPVTKDQTLTIRVAEMLKPDGSLYTDNYRSAQSTDYYTAAKDNTINWSPTFTFHGYRFIELSGFPPETKPEKDWVKSVVLHSDFQKIGTFQSSHQKLNQLESNLCWGIKGNFFDIPTDCPQRNERLGWTGDAQVICPTTMGHFDVHSFWTSWLQSMRAEQHANGLIPNSLPESRTGFVSPGWGDAGVTIPWDVYVRTGDQRILQDNYEMMQEWVNAYELEAKNYIVNRSGFGD